MTGDFNQWLQDLVSDAVSVTPPPPELDGRSPRPTERRPWLGWALAGAAAAAVIAVIVAFAVTSGDDDNVTTAPVTDPSTTLAPATSAAVTTSPASSAPPRSTTTTMAPSTTLAPAIPPTVPTFQPEPAPSVVTAGDDGVWVTSGTERVQWVDEPMSRAAWADDGLIVQRRTGYAQGTWTEDDTLLFKVTSPGGEFEPFLDDLDLGDTPWIELHDTALIEGEQRVLLTLFPPIESLESPDGRLVVTSPDATFEVLDDAFGGWESGSSRLSMSRTGLVVGEFSAEVFRGYVGYSIGDTPAPTRAELGLPADDFQDCGDCPRLYTVSDDGTTIAWLDGTQLVRWDLTVGAPRPRIELGATVDAAGGLAVTDGAAVVSPYEGQGSPATLVTFIGGETDTSLLSAPTAAFGPDAFTTSFVGASDFPGGVGESLAGGAFTENQLYALLLGVIEEQVQGSPADCEDVPRTITRLDDQTIRVRIGCDDAGIGVDYRLDRVGPAADGADIGAQVLRRSVCGRGVSDGLCV